MLKGFSGSGPLRFTNLLTVRAYFGKRGVTLFFGLLTKHLRVVSSF